MDRHAGAAIVSHNVANVVAVSTLDASPHGEDAGGRCCRVAVRGVAVRLMVHQQSAAFARLFDCVVQPVAKVTLRPRWFTAFVELTEQRPCVRLRQREILNECRRRSECRPASVLPCDAGRELGEVRSCPVDDARPAA